MQIGARTSVRAAYGISRLHFGAYVFPARSGTTNDANWTVHSLTAGIHYQFSDRYDR